MTDELPREFGSHSLAFLWDDEPYQRFLREGRIALREASADWEPGDDLQEVQEGRCLVTYWHAWCSTGSRCRRGEEFGPTFQAVLENTWLAEYEDGIIRRICDRNLRETVLSHSDRMGHSVDVFPMAQLEQRTLQRKNIQSPGVYKIIYETGTFTGVLNRGLCGRCNGFCSVQDFVWIEDSMCLAWMRSTFDESMEWIRFFPFRIDRSGGSGRCLEAFRFGFKFFPVEPSRRSARLIRMVESHVPLPRISGLWGIQCRWSDDTGRSWTSSEEDPLQRTNSAQE